MRVAIQAVNFVYDDYGFKAQSKRLFKHEACLRHRPVKRVHKQQNSIHHSEHALNLAAKVGVAGGIYYMDSGVSVFNGGVL